MTNSRQKGARRERQLARLISKVTGRKARRGRQYAGHPDAPDVVVDGWDVPHIECKGVEKFNLYDALEQAEGDAAEEQIPVVFHKRNHKKWVGIVEAKTLIDMLDWYVGDEEL